MNHASRGNRPVPKRRPRFILEITSLKGQKAIAVLGCAMIAVSIGAPGPTVALEAGQEVQTKPGIAIGAFAVPFPAGLYLAVHPFNYELHLTGPGVPPNDVPRGFGVQADPGFIWFPGWNFLGAAYSAYVSFPFTAVSVDPTRAFPGIEFAGVHNTFVSPLRLHWNAGNGWFIQSGLGLYVPDGTIEGPLGNSNIGADYVTFQPNLVFSYLDQNWKLSSYMYYEINTKNEKSGYTSGSIFHLDLTALRTFNEWSFGPVGYYVVQTTADRPNALTDAFLSAAVPVPGGIHGFNAGKFEALAVGGLIGFNFGPTAVQVFATKEIFARAWGGNSGTALLPQIPFATDITTKGWTIFTRWTIPIWLQSTARTAKN
jgi:hypothetical protein